jgi:hypothetical protein
MQSSADVLRADQGDSGERGALPADEYLSTAALDAAGKEG